jgi:GTP-binding protein
MVRAAEHDFVVADVPGLIEGASQGKGLGHEFLRHIERTALILHVLDASGGWEGRDVVEDYAKIQEELACYASELAARPQIVILNKIDTVESSELAKMLKAVRAYIRERALEAADGDIHDERFIEAPVFCVSAVTGEGMDALMAATAQRVFELRVEAAAQAKDREGYAQIWEHKRQQRDQDFSVTNLGGHVFEVTGGAVERMVVQTEWDNEEAVAYLQRRLERIGVEKALAKAGARDGDEVRILNRAFAFEGSFEVEEASKAPAPMSLEAPAPMSSEAGAPLAGE